MKKLIHFYQTYFQSLFKQQKEKSYFIFSETYGKNFKYSLNILNLKIFIHSFRITFYQEDC